MPVVLFENLSTRTVTACLFQTYPSPPSGASVVAWQTRTLDPGDFWRRTWTQAYQLAWVQTLTNPDGGSSEVGGYVDVDPPGRNTATLTYASPRFALVDVRAADPGTVLQIVQDASVPAQRASTGLGMTRSPVLLVPTQPNVPLTFALPPRYWITAGDGYKAGKPLDPTLAVPKKELVFSSDDELYVALLPNNTLTNPTPLSFALAARRRYEDSGDLDGTPER